MSNLTDLRNETVEDPDALCQCANCDTVYKMSELAPIRDFALRASPGETTPAGECPDEDCGAFCYLQADEEADTNSARASADAAWQAKQMDAARAMLAALQLADHRLSEEDYPADAGTRQEIRAAITLAKAAGITATVEA